METASAEMAAVDAVDTVEIKCFRVCRFKIYNITVVTEKLRMNSS